MGELILKIFVENKDLSELKKRERYGIVSGIVGILCNIILSVSKFFIGVISNSVSIMADGINNLSDASSNIVTILGTRCRASFWSWKNGVYKCFSSSFFDISYGI